MQTQTLQVSDDVERLVVVSDIHGFVEPLRVLDGILASCSEPVQVVAGGDYVSTGARPVEAVEWVRRHAGRFAVRGNHDDGALVEAEGQHPPWTEPGVYVRLNPEQRKYLNDLPDVLELTWKGRRIRVTHGLDRLGRLMSWRATTQEVFETFADPEVAVTITGHTHFPFVKSRGGCGVSNSGALSYLMMGFKQDDGPVAWRSPSPHEPAPETFGTFLSVTIDRAGVDVSVERCPFDAQKEIQCLRDAGRRDVAVLNDLLATGIVKR